jgi:hypothetical protein
MTRRRALSAPGRARRALRELGSWLQELKTAGVTSDKRDGMLQGYSSVALRDGGTEVTLRQPVLRPRRRRWR